MSQPHSPGWARVPLSSFFLKFRSVFPIFPQTLLIFFLILALRVGELPTREGPGYATGININDTQNLSIPVKSVLLLTDKSLYTAYRLY